jgi:hypothetical protein
MMNTRFGKTGALAAGAMLAAAMWSGSANAGTCTVPYAQTDPDPSVTESTSCGAGWSTNNDSPLLIEGTNWYEIEKNESGGANTSGALLTPGVVWGTTTSGSWAIDADFATASGYESFMLVMKDGNIPGSDTQWFWFVVDTSVGANACGAGAPAGADYCGTWTMYGVNGNLRGISHMSLYGSGDRPPPPPPPEVPLPGTLALLGLGALGLRFVSVRRKAA